jgi:hypothetical protein
MTSPFEIPVGDEQEQDPEEYFNRVVIVVRGGCVVSVLTNTDEPLEYAVVDFDCLDMDCGDRAAWHDAEPWDDMDDEVREAIGPEDDEATFFCKLCGQEKPLSLRDPVMEDSCEACGDLQLIREDAEGAD